jgi:diguanylate cyclase (GGDEF)-like protein/PAS domain S-box-containing protein
MEAPVTREQMRLLFVEDSERDVKLECRQLERENVKFNWQAVSSDEGLRKALKEFDPHIVVSDFSMPGFSGLQALEIVKTVAPDVPFIFVSGTIGEEMAVRCLREGATDYILKNNLNRLANTVRRAFEQAEQQALAREAEVTKARLAEILEATPDIVTTVDWQGRIVYMNEAGCRLLGLEPEAIIGRKVKEFYTQGAMEHIVAQAVPAALEQGAWQGETTLLTGDGIEIPVSQVIVAHKSLQDEDRLLSSISRDVRERKTFEERIYHLAHHDSLTGLPNRSMLGDRATQALIHARRGGRPAVLLVVHLNNIALVSDGFGHTESDKVLEEVGKRLRNAVRDGDTVARIGADEFAILLADLARAEDSHAVARKIVTELNPPIRVGTRELRVAASIGAAVFPTDGQEFDALLRNAGAAMRRVVAQSRDSFQFYAAEMTTDSLDRLEIETGLQGALDRNEIVMHYQPQFDIRTRRLIGVEALMRWFTPDGKAISPLRFIPVAEETGMIRALGERALRDACTAGLAWMKAGFPPTRVAVNVSTRQLSDEGFADSVRRILQTTGFAPDMLELEITESALINKGETALATLTGLKALGVNIAIDDFGTGYSSLSYLSRLPIDRLKVDRSFVERMTGDKRDAGIVQTVVSLAHGLGLGVIAEGVETEEQLLMLAQMQCDEAQGYLLGRPADADRVLAMLVEGRDR